MSKVIKANQYPPIISNYVIKKRDLPLNAEIKSPQEETKTAVKNHSEDAAKDEVKNTQGKKGQSAELAKPKAPPPPPPEAQAKQVLEKAFAKAKQIVDSAQEYSSRQVQEARVKIAEETAEAKRRGYSEGFAQGSDQGRNEGKSAGYQTGFEEGKKKAAADNRKNVQELSLMIEAVEKSKTKILQDFESDLQNLATAMAKSILKKELEIDERAMRSIILSAMEEYRNQEWIRIYVSDKTANVLLKADNNIVEDLKDISDSVKVIVAPSLDDGGCVIETPDQVIDAGIDSQLKKIKSSIENAMKNQPNN
ncbi:MAG TPA: FliH/SctL family protein [Caproicibacter sp.]|nr:FliH/SctL family protein [Caproicibacter sp.]